MVVQRGFVALMVAVLVGVLGCAVWGVVAPRAAGGSPATAEAAESDAPPSLPAASVAYAPGASADDVAPDQPAAVSVEHGRFQQVSLSGPDGAVEGSPSADGRRWQATGALKYGTTYTWAGQAVGEDGAVVPVSGSFSTVDPAQTAHARINIGDDETVGVGAPIIVQFDEHVEDKAAAERAMTVQTSVPTEGSWAWLPDDNGGSRAHWRPKNYWQSGTQVQVTVHQFGVNDGGGVWGANDVTSRFTIGRSQIVLADVNSHQMVVVRDGQQVMNVPASYGLGSDPNRNTTNGTHIVMSKDELVLMSNPRYGYVNVPEHWAVRIHNNGEFIHANPASAGAQGSENVTHGCVNLSTEDAEAYFQTAIFGDPVEVTNSPVALTQADGDISDWTVPWDQWQTMSALRS